MTSSAERIKETTRLIREARRRWDAHENAACRKMRSEALVLYGTLSKDEKDAIPETHRVWLRYRSEKYFGPQQKKSPMNKEKKKAHAAAHSTASLRIKSPIGSLILLASKKGLTGIYFGHRIETTTLPREDPKNSVLKKTATQVEEYFAKDRETFDVPLDMKGSSFQRAVWRGLSEIPYGETISYGELAERLDNPSAVRAVGTANGVNPISIIVPCHRVIGKDGSLTGYGGGLDLKLKLLQHEGILF
ncbi:methylated-DNA--[protein]-cysteine S-methyltransferase [Akkermansiaceae bacterium]|nr:methylated-DNA--[protein]-cysteine S-methyltransferase [Akkermansiaceae bacterium]MDB4313864.1 methylated-DNA--[protein]-cysteine S-methyltransferase [Akkermansiaceae bacterium]